MSCDTPWALLAATKKKRYPYLKNEPSVFCEYNQRDTSNLPINGDFVASGKDNASSSCKCSCRAPLFSLHHSCNFEESTKLSILFLNGHKLNKIVGNMLFSAAALECQVDQSSSVSIAFTVETFPNGDAKSGSGCPGGSCSE